MILLLDQGNSRLKWLCATSEGSILARGSGERGVSVEMSLRAVQEHLAGTLRQAYASTVAGPENRAELQAAVERLFGIEVAFAKTQRAYDGLKNGYADPATLGVDRWLAMVGGWVLARGPMLVVDAGTAMTIDGVARDGQHVGGFITPGFALQCESLGKRVAALPERIALAPTQEWGRSTDEAITNGVVMELAAFVKAAHVELQASVADTCAIVLTGGDAPLLREVLGGLVTIDEDLVFRGLWATSVPSGVGLGRKPTIG